jgi:hypothetical protein
MLDNLIGTIAGRMESRTQLGGENAISLFLRQELKSRHGDLARIVQDLRMATGDSSHRLSAFRRVLAHVNAQGRGQGTDDSRVANFYFANTAAGRRAAPFQGDVAVEPQLVYGSNRARRGMIGGYERRLQAAIEAGNEPSQASSQDTRHSQPFAIGSGYSQPEPVQQYGTGAGVFYTSGRGSRVDTEHQPMGDSSGSDSESSDESYNRAREDASREIEELQQEIIHTSNVADGLERSHFSRAAQRYEALRNPPAQQPHRSTSVAPTRPRGESTGDGRGETLASALRQTYGRQRGQNPDYYRSQRR